MSNPVVWFEVLGQDADKLRKFYGELLDWKFEVDPQSGYGMVAAAEGGIPGGVGRVATPGAPGWTTFYTRVACLETALETAQRLGSRVLMPITKLPDVTIAVVSDPEGRPVGLCMAP